MKKHTGCYGRRLEIYTLYGYSNSARNLKIKLNSASITGRPPVFYKKLIKFGMEHNYISSRFIEDIIVFGMDMGYWTDVNVLAGLAKYALTDMQTEKRLKEFEEDE